MNLVPSPEPVTSPVPSQAIGHGSLSQRMWQHRHFYLFVSPFFISFLIFGLYPLIYSLYLSFTKWDGLTSPTFVGIENYRTLFSDPLFLTSIINTLIIGIMHVVPMLGLAFIFAILLNGPVKRFRAFFRAAVFIPSITPMVVVATVFMLLYGVEFGLLNFGLQWIGGVLGQQFPGVPWLTEARWAQISVSILLVWRWTGYNMVLMLAGLQNVPQELHESATVDGANTLQRLLHITLPLLRPTLVFCVIMSIVGTVYMFDEVFVLTGGGPGVATTNIGLYLFDQAFGDFRFGYASAVAYVVAAVVFVLSLTVFRLGQEK